MYVDNPLSEHGCVLAKRPCFSGERVIKHDKKASNTQHKGSERFQNPNSGLNVCTAKPTSTQGESSLLSQFTLAFSAAYVNDVPKNIAL